jgi:hypothetical protein
MLILVAIDAEGEFDLVAGILSGWNMAVRAFDVDMRGHQREAGSGVIRGGIGGRNPTINIVAALAPAPVGALKELAAMRVWIVAIRAIGKGHGGFEVRALVARQTLHLEVLSEQREMGCGVIERGSESRLLPRVCTMAGLATLAEFALVGIVVAGRASLEGYADVAWLAVRTGGMAALAWGAEVRPGEPVTRLGVVEALLVDPDGLPINGRMALGAVGSESALMLVLVAGYASGRKAKPGAIQILGGQQGASRCGYVLRIMTGAAPDGGVLSVERIPRLCVIKSL